jgi:hypothetical protein
MNFRLLGLPWLLAALPAAAGTPLDTRHARETVSLEFLMEACSVVGDTAFGMVPNFDCESFLYGVIDTHAAIEDARGDGRRACAPGGLAPWQLYALVDDDVPDESVEPDGEPVDDPTSAFARADAERVRVPIPRSRWNEPAAPLLVELLEKAYPCGGEPAIADGEHAFVERFAEHPLMPGAPVVAIVDGRHIRFEDRRRPPEYPEDRVLAEGELAWHAAAKRWIIVVEPGDATAEEVGGCSDGPETVDLVTREYWTC